MLASDYMYVFEHVCVCTMLLLCVHCTCTDIQMYRCTGVCECGCVGVHNNMISIFFLFLRNSELTGHKVITC